MGNSKCAGLQSPQGILSNGLGGPEGCRWDAPVATGDRRPALWGGRRLLNKEATGRPACRGDGRRLGNRLVHLRHGERSSWRGSRVTRNTQIDHWPKIHILFLIPVLSRGKKNPNTAETTQSNPFFTNKYPERPGSHFGCVAGNLQATK